MNKKLTSFLVLMLFVSPVLFISQFFVTASEENSWIAREPMPTARGGLGVAVVNDKIYAIGGSNIEIQLGITEEYNPVTDTWTVKSPMPTPRSGFAIAVYQNRIYCIGGIIGDSENYVSGITGVTEVYDPLTDTWTTVNPMNTPRADLCASIVNGTIYCMGGKKYWGIDSSYQELNVTEAYDPNTNSWSEKSDMPIPVLGCASAVLDGKIYVIGGSRHFQLGWELDTVGSTQIYDPENDEWTIGVSLPIAQSYGAAAITIGETAPESLYFVGGSNETHYNGITYVYDFELNSWNLGASIPTPRIYLALAVLDDILYAIGGFDGENWLDNTEQYLPIGYGTVPPKLEILSPENKTYIHNDIPLVLSMSRPATWMGYSLDGGDNVTISGDTELLDLSEGNHSITVYITDTFGNTVSSESVAFSVDSFSPQIMVLSPENKTYGGNDIQLVFTLDEPVSWMGYSLNRQENITITGNVTLAALSNGSYEITFYATDLFGNDGASETIFFEIAPFPTVLLTALAVTITITAATAYLLLKRRKKIQQKTKGKIGLS
jgi:N-acetylneuraminic acid mutarotase